MLKQVEGSAAVAEAIALCRPQVICAYPISPQTHIVEGLGRRVDAGELAQPVSRTVLKPAANSSAERQWDAVIKGFERMVRLSVGGGVPCATPWCAGLCVAGGLLTVDVAQPRPAIP